jgi:hypothetical protein
LPSCRCAPSLLPVLPSCSRAPCSPTGPCSAHQSVAARDGLGRVPPDTLLSFSLPRVFLSTRCRRPSSPAPTTAFRGPRRVARMKPELLLRACRPRLPDTFASGSSSRALYLPSRVSESPPARHYRPDTFPGLPSLIAASTCGVHTRGHPKPTLFRPRRFSRPRRFTPPPAFAGLFHPATTSRVRSSGCSPDEKPHGLVARRCPHAVARRPCSQFYPSAPGRRARLQGLAPLASPLQHATV